MAFVSRTQITQWKSLTLYSDQAFPLRAGPSLSAIESAIEGDGDDKIVWGVSALKSMLVEDFALRHVSTSSWDTETRSCPSGSAGSSRHDPSGRAEGGLISYSSSEKAGQKHRYSNEGSRKSNEDDDGDHGNKRPRTEFNRTPNTEPRRFACHFFKRYPSKYQNKRACTGPGFLNKDRLV